MNIPIQLYYKSINFYRQSVMLHNKTAVLLELLKLLKISNKLKVEDIPK